MVEVSCFNHEMHNGFIMGALPQHYRPSGKIIRKNVFYIGSTLAILDFATLDHFLDL